MIGRCRRPKVPKVPGDIILWTFSLFFIAPLFLDAIQFVPQFNIYPAFGPVSRNVGSQGFAAVSVFLATCIITHAVRKSIRSEPPRKEVVRDSPQWPWLLLTLTPIVVVLAAPNPGIYRHFAAPISQRGYGEAFYGLGAAATAVSRYNVYVTWSTYLSAVGLAVWLMRRRGARAFLLIPPVIVMDFWINGKRNIVAVLLIMVFYVLVRDRNMTRHEFRRTIAAAGVILLAVIGFSQWFEGNYRATAVSENEKEVFQVDYGRVNVLQLSIGGALGIVPRPVSYPGESLYLYADNFMSGIFQTEKPISYSERVTSIAFGETPQAQQGGITVSILSEMIDDFGWLGILFGPRTSLLSRGVHIGLVIQ